jgi:hypothetical protein
METIDWTAWCRRIVLVLLITFFFMQDIKTFVHKNLSSLCFTQALVTDYIVATDRQAKLNRFLAYSHLEPNAIHSLEGETSQATMIRSLFMGEYHRFQGDMEVAAYWYSQAIHNDPIPLEQRALSYIPSARLLPDGNVLVDDMSHIDNWQVVNPTNVIDITFENRDGLGFISYQNDLERRDYLVYTVSAGVLPLIYHPVLSLRVKLTTGSYLSVAAKVDGVTQRYLSYYQGTGEWETLRIPLQGSALYKLRFILSEPGKEARTSNYSIWIDWIKLELDTFAQ